MSVSSTTPGRWPARAAYVAAALFIGASGAINVTYGWQKGSDLPGQITWAAVAAAVAIMLALAWPALIRSLENRRWAAAGVALVALVLAGAYSVSAALGSAAGGRTNAETAETDTTKARKRAGEAYDAARDELAKLQAARPVAEIEALLEAAKPVCRIVVQQGRRDSVCTPPPGLTAELGRAKRRADLEGKVERAAGELTKTGPAKVANSDAKALARYLAAIGLDATPERLNDLLVLLSVLAIDFGGGLALALGMALGAAPPGRAERPANSAVSSVEQTRTPQANAGTLAPNAPAVQPVPTRVQPASPDLETWLRHRGGRAQTTMRQLGAVLGQPASSVHATVQRLAAGGVLSVQAGPRGTTLAFTAAGKPN